MCKNARLTPYRGRASTALLALISVAVILCLGWIHPTSRAVEPGVDPASGQPVQLIIRDRRGMEIRVFRLSDLRESGVPVIELESYEMDQVLTL